MIPVLETRRLLLRPLALADAPRIQHLFACWEIVESLAAGIPWPYPEDGAETYVRDCALPAMARNEEFFWTLRLRDEPEDVIGMITLRLSGKDQRGFWIGRPWQGLGLMSEAAEAATDFWFAVLGQPVLRVVKALENEASQRISAGQGMRKVAEFDKEFVGGMKRAVLWETTASEWALHRKQGKGRRGGE